MRGRDMSIASREPVASRGFARLSRRGCGRSSGTRGVFERHRHRARRQELPYQTAAVLRRERVTNPLGNSRSARVRKVRFQALHEHECGPLAKFSHAPKCRLIPQFSPHDVFSGLRMRKFVARAGRQAVQQSLDEYFHVDHR